MNYFIFGNMPSGEYGTSIWDTETILRTNEYYFSTKDKLLYKPAPGDKVVFKEFDSKIYWGEAVIGSGKEQLRMENEDVVLFKIANVVEWMYPLDTERVYDRLSNKDTRTRIVCITEQDYKLIRSEMENNSKISTERQQQLKEMWGSYIPQRVPTQSEFDSVIAEWNVYRSKILGNTFVLDDYTNTLSNLSRNSAESLPGGYLCNFLERTTKDIIGSSKPGKADRFGIKLNNDNTTYLIAYTDENNNLKYSKNGTRDEALMQFEGIKKLITEIVKENNIDRKIDLVENNRSGLRAMQLLRKIVVLDMPSEFIYIYSASVISILYDEFIGENETRPLAQNRDILNFFARLFNIQPLDTENVSKLYSFLWLYHSSKAIVDDNTPNVIMYGPPGTGKTYEVKKSLDFICRGNRKFYEFVQFHPSYTYEDFIEGIRPKGVTSNGNIKFEMVNGVFKEFCMRAKDDPDNKYYFVVDEINRANLSAVFGETLLCLEKDYRHDTHSGKSDNLVKTQYSALIKSLDEGQKNGLVYYKSETGEVYFGVPSNLYFIGMMNDGSL